MEPSLGGMSASPSFGLIFFLSPVSWTPGCLIQQQRGRSSRARRRGLSVEHEVQEGHTGVRLPLSGTQSKASLLVSPTPPQCPHRWLLPWHAWNTTNQPLSPPPPPPLLPHPSCLHAHCEFTVLASTSTTSIHKHMFVRRRRRPVVQELNGIRALQQD